MPLLLLFSKAKSHNHPSPFGKGQGERWITLLSRRFVSWMKRCWGVLREITGDDAYERYLVHWSEHHASEDGEPLSRDAFFKQETERKWNGVKRCC